MTQRYNKDLNCAIAERKKTKKFLLGNILLNLLIFIYKNIMVTKRITLNELKTLVKQIIKEEKTNDKASKGEYLRKFNKKGVLALTAEKLPTGNWIVHEYSGYYGTGLEGEYTDTEFKKN